MTAASPPRAKRLYNTRFLEWQGRRASTDLAQAPLLGGFQHPQAGQIAVVHDPVQLHPLLRAQEAHEVLQYLARDQLPGDEHRDTGRVGDDLVGARPAEQLLPEVVLLVDQRDDLAAAVEGVPRQEAQL